MLSAKESSPELSNFNFEAEFSVGVLNFTLEDGFSAGGG